MSFNNSSIKRLSLIAGIQRENKDIIPFINELVTTFLQTILDELCSLLHYCNRKTITPNDVKVLWRITDRGFIIIPENLPTLLTIEKSDLKKNDGFRIYTTRAPFIRILRKLLPCDICLGKNTSSLIQYLAESYIIKIMNYARVFTMGTRETILPRDIHITSKYI